MSDATVVLTLSKDQSIARIDGTRVTFSPHQCFAFDGGASDIECLRSLASYLKGIPGLVFVGAGYFIDYFMRHVPDIADAVIGTIRYGSGGPDPDGHGLASVDVDMGTLPAEARTVFLCETLAFPRMQLRKWLPAGMEVIEPTVLSEIAPDVIPVHAWTPLPRNIYPIEIPEVRFKDGLDFAIVDAPSRNLSLMPNGLAYLLIHRPN